MVPYRYMLVIVGLSVAAGVAWAGLSDELTEGLISAWTFDDGTARDITGRNDGILRGNARIVEGKNGFGVDISGADSFVEIPHGPSMDAMTDAFTHAAWMFVEQSGDHAGIMFKGEKIGWGPLFHIRMATIGANTLTFGSNTIAGHVRGEKEEGATTPEGYFNADAAYDQGNWVHVAQVGNGQTIQAFVNGVPANITAGYFGANGTDPLPLTAPYDIFADYPIELGVGRGVGGDRTTSIDGIVDEAAIFRRALSAGEIARLADLDIDWAAAVKVEGKLATTWAAMKSRN